MANVKPTLVALWIMIHLLAAIWSRDLPMHNGEQQFMSAENYAAYSDYRDLVHEKQILAFKLELHKPMTSRDYLHINEAWMQIRETFKDLPIEWLEYESIYSKKLGSHSVDEVQTFAAQNPTLLLPLIGTQHAGGVALLDWKLPETKVQELILKVKTHPVFTSLGHVAIAGLPWINLKLNEYANDIKFLLMPAMFMICSVLTFFITQSLRATIALILPCIFALTSSLALIKLLYENLNMISAVVPLRVFVINLAIAFYVYFAARSKGSVADAIRSKRIPLALGIIATALGFGITAVSTIPAVRSLAISAVLCVAVSSVSTLFGLWGCERWIHHGRSLLLQSSTFARRLTPQNQFKIVLGLILASVLISPGQRILTDATLYFPKSSGIKDDLDRVETKFLGTPIIEIETRKPDGSDFTFEDYTKLASIEGELHKALWSSYRIFSLASLGREANHLYSGLNEFPNNRFVWSVLTGGMPENVKQSFPTGAVYRMSLMGRSINHDTYVKHKSVVEDVLSKNQELYSFRLNGLNYQLMESQEHLIVLLGASYVAGLFIISLLFWLCFRSARDAVWFLLAAASPAAIGWILIYTLNFSLNIATMMSFSVSMGIIVSSLIHIYWESRKGISPDTLLTETIQPIACATAVLSIGFALFGLSGFLPIRQEGLIVASMIASGGLIAVLCRPAPFGKLTRPHSSTGFRGTPEFG